ncbi:nitrophenyl compound nitroreductase subunit ArsF family protein [Mangrovibacterium lignilyticum]|uniref:nitrophenyl compound nitroreductase subunit ArsF family protein n=1 Tax=Mangrovibacterium lignilyticum TaxID=2668052 RepID=UPI0013D0DF12|nr:nitrophenyl compound nitroreductase subunit ArsF family protein [Mangrovibacterium lignilyticum]
MKNFLAILLLTVALSACQRKPAFVASEPKMPEAGQTAVYYFRTNFICETCEAVEDIVQDELDSKFAEELKSGKLVFRQLNLNDKETADFALQFDVVFKSLLILKPDTVINLTNEAFLYALPNPGKLRHLLVESLEAVNSED